MPSTAWRINVFGQVVQMTPMQMREYLDFSCRTSLPRSRRRASDWSRTRGTKKHITEVICEYWKADDIGQTFTGFPFRDPARPTRHGSQMWFYAPPSHAKIVQAFRQKKPVSPPDRLQRLEDALARMTQQNTELLQRVEVMEDELHKTSMPACWT